MEERIKEEKHNKMIAEHNKLLAEAMNESLIQINEEPEEEAAIQETCARS